MDAVSLTEQVLKLWQETDAFQQSIQTKSEQLSYTFYDGPPFTSGDPHYGHLLQSIVKDMVPRRMTMRGYRVARKWGWDCHGIPAENFVNKQLGITSKKQVEEEFGLKNYIEACRSMVNQVNDKWKWTIDRIGRRVDMENAYFTMDNEYMESVICLFSTLYHDNLIYKGFKVLGYSRALGTALSNSEIAEGYEMRQDPAVTVKFRMKNAVETRQAVPVQDDDNAIEVVAGILKDEHGRYLMLYDNRVNSRMFPGGKIDAGELPVDALRRERQEELGVEVTSEQFVGHAKFVHQGKLFRLHYFSVEIVGTPVNQEPVKHGMMEWIETIPSENQYGFVLKFDQTVIADPEQMRLEFEDLLLLSDGRLFAQDVLHGDYAVYLLPWTTTPWTLPANMFAAVHRDIDYVLLYDRTDACGYILATACVEKYYKDTASYLVMQQMKGRELVGLWYSPLFSYYHQTSTIDQSYKDRVHTVLHADFVTTESGTGVVHEAPAFGADDYDLVCTVFPREKAQEWLFDPVNEYGEFTDLVSDFVGQNVFEANSAIIKELKQRGLLVKQETVNHSYPHCPRTGTPLIYKAIESRFVKEDDLKQQTVPAAEQMHFVPETVKKRFIEGLKSAPDRNISRTRYWGCPLPVWECTVCDHREVLGSIAEIATKSGQTVTDLHRPYIDEITMSCSCGGTMHRIPDVLDCRFESGSMPYGQDHFMKSVETLKGGNVERGDNNTGIQHVQTILVDAAKGIISCDDAYSIESYKLNTELADYLSTLPQRKIVVTNTSGEKRQKMEALLQGYDFDFFTLENNPSKESPEYFATLLDQYALEPEHIIYFDHQLPALESAQMVGIEQVFWSTELEKAKERLGDRLVTGDNKEEIVLPVGYTFIDNLPVEKWEEFRALRLEALEQEPGAFGPKEKLEAERSFPQKYRVEKLESSGEITLFLLYQERIVGMIRGVRSKIEPEYTGEIVNLYINEDHRKKGIGKIMVERVIEFLQQCSGTNHVRVEVIDTNIHALSFYQQCGFSVENTRMVDIYGTTVKQYILGRSIGSFSNCSDFIAEGLDQTRGWFRALHVLGHAYHGQNVFTNVVVTGMILAEDGKKMSKRLKNYPDPSYLLNQYGADALRLYLLSSPVVRAEPLRFSEKAVDQMVKDVIIPLQNVFNFFKMYAEVDQWKDSGTQVWFMRHAKKDADRSQSDAEGEIEHDKGRPLSEEGVQQLQSIDIVEQVIRIQPQVIVCSDFLRTRQTAHAVKDIMKTHLSKEVEVIETPEWGLDATSETIGNLYTNLLERYEGKRVLIVSHVRRFRYLWNRLFSLGKDMDNPASKASYHIEPTQIIPLPIGVVSNELDQRVLAELHRTIHAVDTALNQYYLETATKELIAFVDKLTNRYLRRSRRRFWDEEMTADKQQAYQTLFAVIHTYLRLCAPFIPFVTEQLWQELICFSDCQDEHPSLHLQSWPCAYTGYINEQLIGEIETVRKIIKGALYLRAKHQIKVKQPLQSLSFGF